MDDYAASYSCIEKLTNATECIKQCLVCRICLELFKDPVTIKCGHKFCRSCILKVTANENSTCPFCNIKIQKRSIPKDGNTLLKLCVERFIALTNAIYSDSGINVLEHCNKVKDTRESITFNEKPSTSKIEKASNQKSIKSKINSQNNKKLALNKKRNSGEVNSSNNEKNTLHKYLSNKCDSAADNIVYPDEKVKNWLDKITPENADDKNFNSDDDITNLNISNSTTSLKSPFSKLKESQENPLHKTYPSANKLTERKNTSTELTDERSQESKYKDIQTRLKEIEMNVKKKKSNSSFQDKIALKAPPPAVPGTSHSDWRRVKRVAKEMQVKTFKSLNVSIEKNTSSAVLDDTVPYNSINDSKNITKECDINNYSSNDFTKQRNSLKIDESCQQHQDQVNDVITSQDNLRTPEKTRNVSNMSDPELTSKLNQLSPLNVKTNKDQEEHSSDESSNFYCKATGDQFQNSSPSKNKLSLKIKLQTNKKPIHSQSSTSDKESLIEDESSKHFTPERPKSRLSLKLPTSATSEYSLQHIKSTAKKSNTENDNSFHKSPSVTANEHCLQRIKSPAKRNNMGTKNSVQNHSIKRLVPLNRPLIQFKKLGNMCKRRKKIPFLLLASMKPKEKVTSYSSDKKNLDIVIKSNESVNINYKPLIQHMQLKDTDYTTLKIIPASNEVKIVPPTEDSQLKFLCNESPSRQRKVNENDNKSFNRTSNQLDVQMELDESPPITNIIVKRQLHLQEDIQNNDISEHSKDVKTNIVEYNKSKTSAENTKVSNVLTNSQSGSSTNIEKCKKNNDPDILENSKNVNPMKRKTSKIQIDVISINSDECILKNRDSDSTEKTNNSESINLDTKDKDKNSEIESNSDSESLSMKRKIPEKRQSISTSTSSSPLRTLTLKKKRTHSESSDDDDDDDDVACIIGKWCDPVEEPIIKKPKLNSYIGNNLDHKKDRSNSKDLKNFVEDENDDTVIDDEPKQSDLPSKLQRDSPIDDIITKVKSYKEIETNTNNKLNAMPSSLLSADLFESNEQYIQPSVQKNAKQLNEITNDNLADSAQNCNKENSKENLNKSENDIDITVVDLEQFNKDKLHASINSDSSNKENNACNESRSNKTVIKAVDSAEDHVDEIENSQNQEPNLAKNPSVSSQPDSYHVPDSLINITQEQLAIKKIEKDLIGVDLSTLHNDKNEEFNTKNKTVTPEKQIRHSQGSNSTTDDFDVDNIETTPVTKRRQLFNFPTSKSANMSISNVSEILSPEKNFNLVPAITPIRNTKSYPLCHSTPMINTPNTDKKSSQMTLICSGLLPENVRIVQNFANKFNAKFLNSFNMEVTHVIVQTDLETKAGQKTFKYIQGIAFKKYVINFQWILDCLEQNRLLDEDDEKYEVLDPYVFESGSKKSRSRSCDLFENFAFYCLEPFNSFALKEFKNLLLYNGATVSSTIKELSNQNKYKVIILESENLSQKQLSILKDSKSALISFEWVVDSISQYHILSLLPYLYEMTVEEVLALGFPPEYLTEEETVEDEDEESP